MPGGDRTGPFGAGPMTGRGLGVCAGYGIPGYANPGIGRGRGGGFGRGFGFGGGRGWRHRFYATGLPGWARGYGGYYAHPVEHTFVPEAPIVAGATEEDELAHLKRQARYFKRTLEDISKRIDALQAETGNREPEDR
jgi:hypothetical protein